MTIAKQALLGPDKHANQHRLSRLIIEANNAELRAIAEAVEQYTDQLIAALEAEEKHIAELEAKLETADRLQDGTFRDGLKAGFSYGQTDDQSGFMQCMSAYSPRAGIKVKE